MGWGGTGVPGQATDQVTEEMNRTTPVFVLLVHGLTNPLYRSTPILPNQVTAQQLRAGMDNQVSGQSSAAAQRRSPAAAEGKIAPEPAP